MKTIYLAAGAAALTIGMATAAVAQDVTPTAPEASAPAQPDTTATAPEAAAPTQPEAAPTAPEAWTPSLPAGISPPPEGMGQIVFFRPSRMAGMALTYTVRENGQDLGRLPNGRFFVHVAEPGIHEYEVGRNDTMRMEIEPGETYYASQSIQMGVFAGRAVLSPSDAETFGGEGTHMRRSDR